MRDTETWLAVPGASKRAVRYCRFGAPHEINLDAELGIRLIGHTGPATVIHKEVEVPCTVAVTDAAVDFIVQGGELACLYMTIQPRDQIAKLNILNVEENSCPLSADMQHKGAFLLGLAEELCRQVGVRTVSLEDSSHVTTSEGLMVDLQFRSVMRHGASWYERQGYVHTCAFLRAAGHGRLRPCAPLRSERSASTSQPSAKALVNR